MLVTAACSSDGDGSSEDTDGFPSVTTYLDSIDPESTDKQAIDEAFTDLVTEQGEVGEYELVPDLGRIAAFGRDPTLAGVGINGWISVSSVRSGTSVSC